MDSLNIIFDQPVERYNEYGRFSVIMATLPLRDTVWRWRIALRADLDRRWPYPKILRRNL